MEFEVGDMIIAKCGTDFFEDRINISAKIIEYNSQYDQYLVCFVGNKDVNGHSGGFSEVSGRVTNRCWYYYANEMIKLGLEK